MASRSLFRHLRTLTNPTRRSVASGTFTSPFNLPALRVHPRLYTDAAAPAPVAPPTPPPALDADKPPPNAKKVMQKSGSLKEAELAKFAAMADQWWEPDGFFKPLHAMNPTRVAFLRSTLCRHFGKDPSSARPLQGLKIVDVGCGGGLLSEPLARLGADVTGIDAMDKNIKIARLHADLDPVTSSIEYHCTTAEQLVKEQKKFDAVLALEVIEHVSNPEEFCKSMSALTVPGGATVISTINRSMRGYAAAVVGAEYILGWLPKGTHDWSNFLTPEELALILHRTSVTVQELAGIVYNPLTGKWLLSDDTGVNFIVLGTKDREASNESPASMV